MPDAGQRHDRGMAAGLGQEALARIDEQDREIGAGRAGCHVAGILLMAGRVGDDEGTFRGRNIAIGDIDRDPLFALGLEPVHEQCEVDIAAVGAMPPRIALERFKLIVEDKALLVEQAADQRRFAVVDRAASEQSERRTRGASSR